MRHETNEKKHHNKKVKPWVLDKNRDDIRGWPVRDVLGDTLGTVSELLVDTDSGDVARVKLADGSFLNAHDLRMGDHELFVDDLSEGTIEPRTGGTMPTARPTKH